MANWCRNTIEVIGKREDLKRFDKQFKKTSERFTGSTIYVRKENLEDILSMPECENTENYKILPVEGSDKVAVIIVDGIETKAGYSYSNFVPMTKEDFLNGWYDWSIANWGTKWDCDDEVYVTGLEKLNEAGGSDEDICVVYRILSPWTPCIPVVKEMSKQYPTLKFIHSFDESGLCYAGFVKFKGGVVIASEKVSGEDYKKFSDEDFEKGMF